MSALYNGMPLKEAIFYASTGNILAIILNYIFGYWLYEKTKRKLNSSKVGSKSLFYGHKYGHFTLLLSWLPIIGDPLTLVAGLLKLNFIWFIVIAGSLRIGRYYFLGSII